MDAGIRTHLQNKLPELPEDPAHELLTAASTYSLLHRATVRAKPFEGKLAEAIPERTTGNPALSKLVQRLLREPYRLALPEFVQVCHRRGYELPPESVPALLDQALKDPVLQQHLPDLTGMLGIWLCNQNPDWSVLQWDADISDWASLSVEVRYGLLQRIRRQAPDQARDFLGQVWSVLSHLEKQRLLSVFQISLSKSDEAFLERVLEDGRQEVRKVAAGLLLQLDGSSRMELIWEELQALLQVKGKVLRLKLPEEAHDFFQTYRLIDSALVKSLSLRESWLYFRVAAMPIFRWNVLGRPARLIDLADRNPDGESLLRAWWSASLRDQNPEWADAWLEWLIARKKMPEWLYKEELRLFAERLSPKKMNETLAGVIRKQEGLIADGSVLHQLLIVSPHIWGEELSWLFLSRFQEYVEEVGSFFWDSWHYRDLLQRAAFQIWPPLAHELTAQWANGEVNWGMWEKEVGYLLDILVFRQEFWRALES